MALTTFVTNLNTMIKKTIKNPGALGRRSGGYYSLSGIARRLTPVWIGKGGSDQSKAEAQTAARMYATTKRKDGKYGHVSYAEVLDAITTSRIPLLKGIDEQELLNIYKFGAFELDGFIYRFEDGRYVKYPNHSAV